VRHKPGYVHYRSEVANEICRRLRHGESLTSICRDPHMPDRTAVQLWCRTYPSFARRYASARGRDRDRTEEFFERVAAGEPIRAVCREPGMPSQSAVTRRKADPAFRARYDKARFRGSLVPKRVAPVVADEIFMRIAFSEPLKSICRDPHLPAFCTVQRWRLESPYFFIGYEHARQDQANYNADLAAEIRHAICDGSLDPKTGMALFKIIRAQQHSWRYPRPLPYIAAPESSREYASLGQRFQARSAGPEADLGRDRPDLPEPATAADPAPAPATAPPAIEAAQRGCITSIGIPSRSSCGRIRCASPTTTQTKLLGLRIPRAASSSCCTVMPR
jgi:hypothetical protein